MEFPEPLCELAPDDAPLTYTVAVLPSYVPATCHQLEVLTIVAESAIILLPPLRTAKRILPFVPESPMLSKYDEIPPLAPHFEMILWIPTMEEGLIHAERVTPLVAYNEFESGA